MKIQKYANGFGVITLVAGLATGCSVTRSSLSSADSLANINVQSVQQTIMQARTAFAAAEKEGFAWRDTGTFIKQAEKALRDGNLAKANYLASKALEQSELAIKQGVEQDRAVKARFNKL